MIRTDRRVRRSRGAGGDLDVLVDDDLVGRLERCVLGLGRRELAREIRREDRTADGDEGEDQRERQTAQGHASSV